MIRVFLFALLVGCQPLLVSKGYQVDWEIKGEHSLFYHKFNRLFSQYKSLVTSYKPVKITLEFENVKNAPLVYIPSSKANEQVNVACWHMKYIVRYTIHIEGEPQRQGVLKTQCSYQDKDDYGNLLVIDRGYDKVMSQMMQEIVVVLNEMPKS